MIIVIACLAGLIAYKMGVWRHSCMIWEQELPLNLPGGWRKPGFRFFTWLVVAASSIYFAYVMSQLISIEFNELIGKFSFGVILFLRMTASHFAARAKCEREKKIIDAIYGSWKKENGIE